jgi:hypothetical protein
VICVAFDIGDTDTIKLLNPDGDLASSSGLIGRDDPMVGDLVWARKTDPSGALFTYTKDVTPGQKNVFPFEATNIAIRKCGIAKKSYGAPSDFEYKANYTFDVNPEFSGGSFYGGTCTHWIISDEGFFAELNLDSLPVVEELRQIPLEGRSKDTEGSCFYTDKSTGVTKIAYVDERDRSVLLCDILTAAQEGVIDRDSSNCLIIGLTDEQKFDTALTSSEPNEGFEGVGK